MPIPFILGGIAAVAAATVADIAKNVSDVKKMNDAKDSIDKAKERDEQNIIRYNDTAKRTQKILDSFGKLELETLQSFQDYYALIGRIKNLPTSKFPSPFSETTSQYSPLEPLNTSIDAEKFLPNISTVLAVVGALLPPASSLIIKLYGNLYGNVLSDKAEEAWKQVTDREAKINKTCAYLDHLATSTERLQKAFHQVDKIYRQQRKQLDELINHNKKNTRRMRRIFQEEEKVIIENLDFLICLLYKMATIKLLLKESDNDEIPQVNDEEISKIVYVVNKLFPEVQEK